MATYLVFFGKSQDFNACYFDESQALDNFNAVIRDFDKLESKVFNAYSEQKADTVLSREYFVHSGQPFSLLKLFGFAQAKNGGRDKGTIYGVGLISNARLSLSQKNLELLRVAKDSFAKLSLENFKFNKTDFGEDAHKIWRAITHNKDGNLLSKIDLSAFAGVPAKSETKGIHVQSLISDSVALGGYLQNETHFYISESLDHLKQNHNHWVRFQQSSKLMLFQKSGNTIVPYSEPKPIDTPPPSNPFKGKKPNFSRPESENSDELKQQLTEAKNWLKHLSRRNKLYLYLIVSLVAMVFCLLFFYINEALEPKVETVTETKPNEPNPFLSDNPEQQKQAIHFYSVLYRCSELGNKKPSKKELDEIRTAIDGVRKWGLPASYISLLNKAEKLLPQIIEKPSANAPAKPAVNDSGSTKPKNKNSDSASSKP